MAGDALLVGSLTQLRPIVAVAARGLVTIGGNQESGGLVHDMVAPLAGTIQGLQVLVMIKGFHAGGRRLEPLDAAGHVAGAAQGRVGALLLVEMTVAANGVGEVTVPFLLCESQVAGRAPLVARRTPISTQSLDMGAVIEHGRRPHTVAIAQQHRPGHRSGGHEHTDQAPPHDPHHQPTSAALDPGSSMHSARISMRNLVFILSS